MPSKIHSIILQLKQVYLNSERTSMKRFIPFKLIIIFIAASLFNLNANDKIITNDDYIKAFRAVIRFNQLFLNKQAPAISKLIDYGIILMEKNSTLDDAFFTPNNVEVTKTRLWQYARAEKPKAQSERALLRIEFIQELTVLRNFFTHFADSLAEGNQASVAVLETINQFERDFS